MTQHHHHHQTVCLFLLFVSSQLAIPQMASSFVVVVAAAAAATNSRTSTINATSKFAQLANEAANNHVNQRTLTADQQMAMAMLLSGAGKPDSDLLPYKCAKYCACSTVQALDASTGLTVNLTRASCESAQFSDVLTIDRRTQIIHISLPVRAEARAPDESSKSLRAQINGGNKTGDRGAQLEDSAEEMLQQQSKQQQITTTTTTSGNTKRKHLELMTKLLNLNVSQELVAVGQSLHENQQQHFRMPRLMQFSLLREIVIINLRIEVCDSEIFKRNQRLLKLKWNFNQLKQVSKSCFKHLDKLFELNLDHNQLDELESALFSPLVSLRHLSLAHNQLFELTAHQFANLTQLISLNLVGNSFKVINLNLFEPMQDSLQLLILAKNQIRQFVVVQPAVVASARNLTTANGPTTNLTSVATTVSQQQQQQQQQQMANPLAGVIFRNLIKLNVDFNKFERIKLLQLHRFFNVKFLSVRGNNIASIRDKAFNGLKLVELNLASNKLQSISRCAFCNSTIKRLNLAQNNISMPVGVAGLPVVSAAAAAAAATSVSSVATTGGVSTLMQPNAQQLVAADQEQQQQQTSSSPLILNPPASSASMLVLAQSIFGPLFGHLEYLDLSQNKFLANQLEFLLEPLLELQYLNLAAIGLDQTLPTPSLFKNLRHLRYLNLSMNRLDQLVAETIEPLSELELLDVSQNDFSELDESFLVVLDDLPLLKFVNFASNPWYCSQCKISTLYDWIQRSPIYNSTCLAQQTIASFNSASPPLADGIADSSQVGGNLKDGELDNGVASHGGESANDNSRKLDVELTQQDANMGFIYRHSAQDSEQASDRDEASDHRTATLARGPHDYSLSLADNGNSAQKQQHLSSSSQVDFDLILDLFEDSSSSLLSSLDELAQGTLDSSLGTTLSSDAVPNYRFVSSATTSNTGDISLDSHIRSKKRQLSGRLLRSLSSQEDDTSIGRTLASLQAASQLVSGQLDGETTEQLLQKYFARVDFCLKCEFPSELRSFNLHELAPADFKYCAGSAPRFATSEPKIGLTLAIVIIGALFVVIIVIIVMYRKKSNTYYPGEDLTDQLESGHHQQTGARRAAGRADGSAGNGQPVLSISSDMEHQYGDNTDYSSPPMSQSQSYSGEELSYTDKSGSQDEQQEEEEDEEDQDDDAEDQDVEGQYDEEEEGEDEEEEEDDEENDEEEEFDEEEEDEENDDDRPGGGGQSSQPLTLFTLETNQNGGEHHDANHHNQNDNQHTHPNARFESNESNDETRRQRDDELTEEKRQAELSKVKAATTTTTAKKQNMSHVKHTKSVSSRQSSREHTPSTSRSKSTTNAIFSSPSSHILRESTTPDSTLNSTTSPGGGGSGSLSRVKKASLNKTLQSSGDGNFERADEHRMQPGELVGGPKKQPAAAAVMSRQQLTHNDRDDSTPIFIGPYKQQNAADPGHRQANIFSPSASFEPASSPQRGALSAGGPPSDATTPASLSATDLLVASSLSNAKATHAGEPEVDSFDSARKYRQHANRGARTNKLVQVASVASSLSESHSRARTRQRKSEKTHKAGDALVQQAAAEEEKIARDELSGRAKLLGKEGGSPVATLPKTILHHGHVQVTQQPAVTRLAQDRRFQHSHRQSSEHSTAGSVSFAATSLGAQRNNYNARQHFATLQATETNKEETRPVTSRLESEDEQQQHRRAQTRTNRRERIQRSSQTICVDQVESVLDRRRPGRARVVEQATSTAGIRSSNEQQHNNIDGPANSRGLLLDLSPPPPLATRMELIGSPIGLGERSARSAATRQTNAQVSSQKRTTNVENYHEPDENHLLMEFCANPTAQKNVLEQADELPIRIDQAKHASPGFGAVEEQDFQLAPHVAGAGPPNARQTTTTLRGGARPLIKQAHHNTQQTPLMSPVLREYQIDRQTTTAPTNRKLTSAIQQQQQQVEEQIIQFDDSGDSICFGVNEAHLNELPSDLDETDVEQVLYDEHDYAPNVVGGALEFDDDDDDDEDKDGDGDGDHQRHRQQQQQQTDRVQASRGLHGPFGSRRDNNNNNTVNFVGPSSQLVASRAPPTTTSFLMRNSNSTQSALTQTGSCDFET